MSDQEPEAPPSADKPKVKSAKVTDPEMIVLNKVVKLLGELEAPAASRVVDYISKRFDDEHPF